MQSDIGLSQASVVIAGAGAGRGLGRELPLGFARAGANLTLNVFEESTADLDRLNRDLEIFNVDAQLLEGDISDEATAEKLITAATDRHGRIDVLVNNAGISTPALCHDLTLTTWQRMLDVNLTAAFLTTRAALRQMLQQRSGRIINIASQIGQKGGIAHAHYAAAKAGLIGFTKSVAREVGASGITVNAVAPGPLDTRLMNDVPADWLAEKLGELVIPRLGLPEEVVPSVLFLASPAGNLYTGQTLGPNCGDVML
jgi:3-oxoacyl-[acyl-carrier protein] reductase